MHVGLRRRFGQVGNPCTGIMGPKCSTEMHAHGIMTGHFTATVWNKSHELGCGYVVCNRQCTGKRPVIMVGCQYYPGELYKTKNNLISPLLESTPLDKCQVLLRRHCTATEKIASWQKLPRSSCGLSAAELVGIL